MIPPIDSSATCFKHFLNKLNLYVEFYSFISPRDTYDWNVFKGRLAVLEIVKFPRMVKENLKNNTELLGYL